VDKVRLGRTEGEPRHRVEGIVGDSNCRSEVLLYVSYGFI